MPAAGKAKSDSLRVLPTYGFPKYYDYSPILSMKKDEGGGGGGGGIVQLLATSGGNLACSIFWLWWLLFRVLSGLSL